MGHIRAPGINNWDFSLSKIASLGSEHRQLKLEADVFNLFNTAHFGAPNTTLDTASFGAINSDRLPPRYIQLGAKFTF